MSYCSHMVPNILMAGTEYFSLQLISLNYYLRVTKEASELTADTDFQNLSVVQLSLRKFDPFSRLHNDNDTEINQEDRSVTVLQIF